MRERGDGLTTRQMLKLKNGGVFVWCNHHLDYPKYLAFELGRPDIEIVSPSWLERGLFRGRWLSDFDIDHALHMNYRQREGSIFAAARVEK